MGNVVLKKQCPSCASSGKDVSQDNLAVYEDGGEFCFACSYFSAGKEEAPEFLPVTYEAIPSRGLTKEACEFMRYGISGMQHVAEYYKNTTLVAQKARTKDKKFKILGNGKDLPLWGLDLWRHDPNKPIVITEGEIDAVTVAQCTSFNVPVVSLPNGASCAVTSLKQNLESLLKFKQVVLAFDMDEAGQKAAKAAVALFSPGKVSIARFTEKDANALLLAGKQNELVNALLSPPTYCPPGITLWEDLDYEDLKKPVGRGLQILYPKLNEVIRGYTKARLHTITALTGAGKTTISKEFMYDLIINHGQKVGGIFLEESTNEAALSLISLDTNTPIKNLRENPKLLDEETFSKAFNKFKGKVVLTGEFDLSKPEEILSKLEYLAVSEEVDYIIYDNISFTIGGSPATEDGERKYIDIIMGKLRSLIHRTGVGVIMLVQMKKIDLRDAKNKDEKSPWEDINLNDIKGSGSIAQGSDTVIAVERHKTMGDLRRINVLKNRVGGRVGPVDNLRFTMSTGRLDLV